MKGAPPKTARHARAALAALAPAFALALALALACAAENSLDQMPRATLQIGAAKIEAEVADTPARQARGLSGRAALPEGRGMWFPFPAPRLAQFWMNEMNFPLDFVWVRGGIILDLHKDIPHQGGRKVRIQPRAPADGVLEVPAGTIARHGWQRGDRVQITLLQARR